MRVRPWTCSVFLYCSQFITDVQSTSVDRGENASKKIHLSASPLEEKPWDVLLFITFGVLVLLAALTVVVAMSAGEIRDVCHFLRHICCFCFKTKKKTSIEHIAMMSQSLEQEDSDDHETQEDAQECSRSFTDEL